MQAALVERRFFHVRNQAGLVASSPSSSVMR